MLPDSENLDPGMWDQYYKAALIEKDPLLRAQLIDRAQSAILQRASALEESEASDKECGVLEQAAESLKRLKLHLQSDGLSKHKTSDASIRSVWNDTNKSEPNS
jgi:hypothetical protein